MDRDSKLIIRKVIFDFIVLSCVALPILFLYLWGKPYERGFFCDDESLKHPYKDSTVTNIMLYIFGLAVPIITMSSTEYFRLRNAKNARPRSCMGHEIPAWCWEAYKIVGIFLFGTACQQLTTDIAKYTVGRLRPHFFTVCQPSVDCDLPENRWRYIETFECQGADPRLLKEMRLSFPSGHSSFSAYTMIFFAMYMHKRFRWNGSQLLRHGLQFLVVSLSWFTVLTRISDYKHHWSDVMAGFCIGTLFAIIVFAFASDLRKTPKIHRPTATRNNYDSEMNNTNGAARHV